MRTMVDTALHYASLGYAVFPCTSGTRPVPLTPHGFKDATSDPDQIAEWWHVWPTPASAYRQLACWWWMWTTRRTPGWPTSPSWLAAWPPPRPRSPLEAGGTTSSPTPGKEWRCSVSELAPHVDIRTDGGLFIAPPSLRSDGAYLWVEGCELEVPRDQLPEPPQWLVGPSMN